MKARLTAALAAAALAAAAWMAPAAGAAAARTDVLRAARTAAVTRTSLPWRLQALRWAHTQAGCWYSWGGAGPCTWGYDCSGLVSAAYARAGVWLPHNTVQMLYSGKLRWEPRSQARWGDLVMWGGSSPFHVELYNGYNGLLTFGAHSQGTRVGYAWQGGWWYDNEAFYRVV